MTNIIVTTLRLRHDLRCVMLLVMLLGVVCSGGWSREATEAVPPDSKIQNLFVFSNLLISSNTSYITFKHFMLVIFMIQMFIETLLTGQVEFF